MRVGGPDRVRWWLYRQGHSGAWLRSTAARLVASRPGSIPRLEPFDYGVFPPAFAGGGGIICVATQM